MSLFEQSQLLPGRFQSRLVELGFESEVVEMRLGAVGFQLGKGHQRGKDVVLLGVGQFSGRLGQSRVALERLVILFDFPPFVIDLEESRTRQTQVAGTKNQRALCSLSVFEELTANP